MSRNECSNPMPDGSPCLECRVRVMIWKHYNDLGQEVDVDEVLTMMLNIAGEFLGHGEFGDVVRACKYLVATAKETHKELLKELEPGRTLN